MFALTPLGGGGDEVANQRLCSATIKASDHTPVASMEQRNAEVPSDGGLYVDLKLQRWLCSRSVGCAGTLWQLQWDCSRCRNLRFHSISNNDCGSADMLRVRAGRHSLPQLPEPARCQTR
jgi:hypothetical protein